MGPSTFCDNENEDLQVQFHHTRNKTGIVGGDGKMWSDDPIVNDLWVKLSTHPGNGVEDLQKSFANHILITLARTHFNLDNMAGYQASAHM